MRVVSGEGAYSFHYIFHATLVIRCSRVELMDKPAHMSVRGYQTWNPVCQTFDTDAANCPVKAFCYICDNSEVDSLC